MIWLRTLLLTVFGVIAGFGLAIWWVDSRTPTPPPAQERRTLAAPTATTSPPGLTSAVVDVVLIDAARPGQIETTIPGVVVGSADFVITDAALIAGASRLYIVTGDGRRQRVDQVWGADDVYGLVALRPAEVLSGVAVLELARGAGSLRIGAPLALVSADGVGDGQISSAAQRDELGAYYYDYTDHSLRQRDVVALTEPTTNRLLGLSVRRDPGGGDFGPIAIDAEPVARLLAARARGATLSVSEFSSHYYDGTTQGRIKRLRALLSADRYDEAIAHAQSIVNLDDVAQRQVPPLAREALAARTRQLFDESRFAEGLALLDDATGWVTFDATLGALRADALVALGRDAEALVALLDNGQQERARMHVMQKALTAGQEPATVALIESALHADPDFAPYHRLLGEHHARTGNVADAVARLSRAIELDPSLARDLGPLIARLRARRHTPAVAEIPIQRSGGTMLVDTHINGSAQPFRFMVDTGASYTAISIETALRLGLRDIFLGAPVVELETANGRVFTTTAQLDSVQIGTARVDDVQAVILETTGRFDGLLGQSFLRHFDIEIDRTRGVIALHRRPGD